MRISKHKIPGPHRPAQLQGYNRRVYTPQLLDHFQNPRNAGELKDPDLSAQVQNPACGDILFLAANLRHGRIVEIRFKAKGCVPAMACGSALTELVLDRTIDEAKALGVADLSLVVGSLPQASTHAAHLALDALRALLKSAGG